jgi:hypothetical protein
MLSFAQTGLDLRRPTTDPDPGLVRLINLDRRSEERMAYRRLLDLIMCFATSSVVCILVNKNHEQYYDDELLLFNKLEEAED